MINHIMLLAAQSYRNHPNKRKLISSQHSTHLCREEPVGHVRRACSGSVWKVKVSRPLTPAPNCLLPGDQPGLACICSCPDHEGTLLAQFSAVMVEGIKKHGVTILRFICKRTNFMNLHQTDTLLWGCSKG